MNCVLGRKKITILLITCVKFSHEIILISCHPTLSTEDFWQPIQGNSNMLLKQSFSLHYFLFLPNYVLDEAMVREEGGKMKSLLVWGDEPYSSNFNFVDTESNN